MSNNQLITPELNYETIKSMIYFIRGQKVMLDHDLAKIYGYSTRSFNQQVSRNIERFPSDFMFQLTKDEINSILMSQNVTSSWGGSRKLPYAFTEQGIYMLMTVLKGELAINQSKMLIRTFKAMKDYIVENKIMLTTNETIKLTSLVNNHEQRLNQIEEKLEIVMDNFIDPSTYKHYLILDGEKIEADIAYQEIYRKAKSSIYVIDDYIDVKTLQLLKCCKSNVNIIIFTDNKAVNNLSSTFINDFKSDTNLNITLKKNNNRFHDRYIVIDFNRSSEIIFHCGSSSKDSGNKITTISRVEDTKLYKPVINDILTHDDLVL